jgi:hypothetical protein
MPPVAQPEYPWFPRQWALLLLALILACTAGARLKAIELPLERDEGEYAYGGQLLLQGVPPYQAAYNMKFPGTYVAYAAILAVFGETTRGVHLGLLLVNAAAIALVYLLGTWLAGRLGGVVAAGSYAVLAMSPSVLGLAGHATHFIVVPALGGVALLIRARERGGLGTVFLAGMLFGLAVLMKQHAIFFALFGVANTLLTSRAVHRLSWRPALARTGILLLGIAAPVAATVLYLLRSDVFDPFWFWTVDYARLYAAQLSPAEGWSSFLRNFPVAVGPSALLWLLAGVGLIVTWLERDRGRALWISGLALASILATVPGYWFRPHYFIVMLPIVAMLAGSAVASLGRFLARGTVAPAWSLTLCATIAAACLAPSIRDIADLLVKSPFAMSRGLYGTDPFPEALEISRHIAANTAPEARIAVLGSEPQIYFHSRRRSATAHIYTYGLMELVRGPVGAGAAEPAAWIPQPHARRMQDEMIHDLESGEPEYVVFAQVATSWLARPESDQRILEWARTHVSERYDLVGVADMFEDGTEYRWWDEAARYEPRSEQVMYVFRKRPPVATAIR